MSRRILRIWHALSSYHFILLMTALFSILGGIIGTVQVLNLDHQRQRKQQQGTEAWRLESQIALPIISSSFIVPTGRKSSKRTNMREGLERNMATQLNVTFKNDSHINITMNHGMETNDTRRIVYICGWERGQLSDLLFPEYKKEYFTKHVRTRNTTNDLLFFGLFGPCPSEASGVVLLKKSDVITMHWIAKHFHGKTLIVNGEGSRGNHHDMPFLSSSPLSKMKSNEPGQQQRHVMQDKFFQIGLRPDTPLTTMTNMTKISKTGSTTTIATVTTLTSVHVIFLATVLFGEYPPKLWKKVFSHDSKPHSLRTRFCIYAVSNCAVAYRQVAADTIADYFRYNNKNNNNTRTTNRMNMNTTTTIQYPPLVVDQGGPCRGMNGTKLNAITNKKRGSPRSWINNRYLFRNYRFCIVMENENTFGYITEKILNAFLGGCIPIYYGTEEIFDIFNANAFIYYNISNPMPALQRIQLLEHNETAYLQVMREEPILAQHDNHVIDKYFSLTDDVANGTLKRKIRTMMGLSS